MGNHNLSMIEDSQTAPDAIQSNIKRIKKADYIIEPKHRWFTPDPNARDAFLLKMNPKDYFLHYHAVV
jgi:hypothetical protein